MLYREWIVGRQEHKQSNWVRDMKEVLRGAGSLNQSVAKSLKRLNISNDERRIKDNN